MQLDARQRRLRALYEFKDLLQGAAFPFIFQLVLSASVISFAGYGDVSLSVTVLVVGEIMLAVAYFIFGKQNGSVAYRKKTVNTKKREMQSDDIKVQFRTGEYSLWKGAVIAFISVVPYIIIQFIHCLAPNRVCEFALKYAFGWAEFPFLTMGIGVQWLNFIWITIPITVHTVAYYFGGYKEAQRQALAEKAQNIKDRKRR